MHCNYRQVKRASMLWALQICKFRKEEVELTCEELKQLALVSQMKFQPNFLQDFLTEIIPKRAVFADEIEIGLLPEDL